MSTLRIAGLRAAIDGTEILRGVDLELRSGEVHVIMGPNGAGKSTLGSVLMGHPSYEVLGGTVTLDGEELLGLPVWQRAQAGLFIAPQDPLEIPGVQLAVALREAIAARGGASSVAESKLGDRIATEAKGLGLGTAVLDRGINVDCSGGEKKRIETLQLAVLRPRFAVLDELDSGLDIDAMRSVARRLERATKGDDDQQGLGALVITHHGRLLAELKPDFVHVFVGGRIVASGGPELAHELEGTGYGAYLAAE